MLDCTVRDASSRRQAVDGCVVVHTTTAPPCFHYEPRVCTVTRFRQVLDDTSTAVFTVTTNMDPGFLAFEPARLRDNGASRQLIQTLEVRCIGSLSARKDAVESHACCDRTRVVCTPFP